MPARLKLIVAYDGAPFSGWQSQPDKNGVQDCLEQAFAQICGEPVRVHGAGRTDAGVHALAQCAHVDLSARRYDSERWISALNGVLPPAIRIMRAGWASPSFHARFSAKGKLYRYRVWNEEVLPPLEFGRAWHVRGDLDLEAMQTAAMQLLGRHDFRSFAANRGSVVKDTARTVVKARIHRAGALVSVEIEAEGFLYKMARLIVGSLVRIGLGTSGPGEIGDRLANPQHSLSGPRTAAPACGLFLVRVRY
jgi:tRNA pseudouridine38-40 synthase